MLDQIKEAIAWLEPFDTDINLTSDHVRAVKTLLDFAKQSSDKDKRIKELECVLDAWQSVFGTTQLTHAETRLRVAEETVGKQEAILQKLREVIFPKEDKC